MSEFIDEAQLHAKAGNGGAGAVSFRREAHVSKGGPDGGDGGDGGDVLLKASSRISSLLAFRDQPFRRADSGAHGSSKNKFGRRGQSTVVNVPVGTVIKTVENEILQELVTENQTWVAARGGRGGFGNARFLTNQRRAPGFAEQGEAGEDIWYNLELKLMADVALVGFPNVGKSTLISAISNAKPKIANYPFTTLRPNLGVVKTEGEISDFVVADIPGLVEGAADGKGLGHKFLRHIERALVLVFLVDLSPFCDKSPLEQVKILKAEVRKYRKELLARPSLIVGSKFDQKQDDNAILSTVKFDLQISSITRYNLDKLVFKLTDLVAKQKFEFADGQVNSDEEAVYKPIPKGLKVTKTDDNTFLVTGRDAIQAIGLSDLNDPEAISIIDKRLNKLNLNKELLKAGAESGATVIVGDFSFTWEP
jgi:GTP-binding protein